MKPPSLTLGIEEEYQIIDPTTRELKSYITELLAGDHLVLAQVKPELHQSIVEVGTTVCRTPAEVRAELVRLRRDIMGLTAKNGLRIAAAGTHPFSSWMQQEITPLERYLGLRQDMADLAQRLLIFGTHVHIGIEDREFLIDALNVARYVLPHVLCLSTSSPFWIGRKTGLKSYRSVVFRGFPRTGVPRALRSWSEYTELVDMLTRTGSIPDGSKIWWDVRPNWSYPTLEFRICDVCTRVDEAVCIAAILQAVVAKLWKLRRENMTLRVYPADFIEENKWRAVRYGLDGRLIDFAEGLPALRKKVLTDMALPGLSREKVIATVVRLLDKTLIRVGNDEYARDNGSYGLTTMRAKHVEVDGSTVRFEFKGKSGKTHSIDVNDARAARIVRRCRELPGYELFQYIDQDGERRTVGSEDVNDYVRDAMGQDFTAKDLLTIGFLSPLAEDAQLELTHRALQPQQQIGH